MERETGYIDGPRCECGNGVAAEGDWCDDCLAQREHDDQVDAAMAEQRCPCCGCLTCGYEPIGED